MLSAIENNSTSVLDLIAQHLDVGVPEDFSRVGSSSGEIALFLSMSQGFNLLNFILLKLDTVIK